MLVSNPGKADGLLGGVMLGAVVDEPWLHAPSATASPSATGLERTRMRSLRLADLSRLPLEEVHEDELAERHRRREVRLAAADLRDALYELHQRAIARQHERVDHDPRATTVGDLANRLRDDRRVQAKRVLVDLPVGHRQRAGLAIGDHDDLPHVFL